MLSGGTTAIDAIGTALTSADNLVVNGTTISFNTTATTGSATAGTLSIDVATGTIGDILSAIDAITGNTGTPLGRAGELQLQTGTTADLAITGSANALAALGLGTGVTQARGGGAVTTPRLPAARCWPDGYRRRTDLPVRVGRHHLGRWQDPLVLRLGCGWFGWYCGQHDLSRSAYRDGRQPALGNRYRHRRHRLGGRERRRHAAYRHHQRPQHHQLEHGCSECARSWHRGDHQGRGGSQSGLTGETLTIGATGDGTATNITFGTGANQVSTLNELNTALAANNLQATIDPTGVLTLTTATTLPRRRSAPSAALPPQRARLSRVQRCDWTAAVADPNSQATRAGLISQYNNILQQINTTSQDSSFNGINLLEGDTLKLTFDETGKSTLAITGVTFNTAGLGLSTLTAGTDFLDSNSANSVLASLTNVSSTLRSEASNLGSNLSIVQIRQDFSKNLIDVLQTGASNLTLADTNEEAANSQALSTRQSIAVSALALANPSQQSVLQLLR